MYIFRGTDPEVQYVHSLYNTVSACVYVHLYLQEPVVSSGHICSFEAMEVRFVLLDEVMKNPENPTEDLVVDLDIKVWCV